MGKLLTFKSKAERNLADKAAFEPDSEEELVDRLSPEKIAKGLRDFFSPKQIADLNREFEDGVEIVDIPD